MQHGTQRGLSSELFESLKVYLNNSNRLQPIIGLCSITECVKAGSDRGGEAVYLCEVCVCRLSKGDMRNHIMGSLHRYNYTKVWHPDLLANMKQTGADMSLLAWPLMDIARMLEEKEGPGDIKLLEVEDSAFEMLKRASDNDAVDLSRTLMYGSEELDSHLNDKFEEEEEEEDEDDEAHRVVTVGFGEGQSAVGDGSVWPKKVRPSFGHSLRDRYKGKKPLLGLFRVTECVCQEDARTYCFLCHCCRARVSARYFIRHVGSLAHVRSYLMETRREQAEAAAGPRGPLAASARKVALQEGPGDMEVIRAPRFICEKLAHKSYDWCIKRLWKTNIPTVRECHQGKQGGFRVKKNVKGQVVFKVSLPLTEGQLLLERTSFSRESPAQEPPRPDFDDPGAEDSGVVTLDPDPPSDRRNERSVPWQTEGAPVTQDWLNSQWRDWLPTPFQKQENPPPLHYNGAPMEFRSIPVVHTAPPWAQDYQAAPPSFPEYQPYDIPPWSYPPPYSTPPVFHPAGSALMIQK